MIKDLTIKSIFGGIAPTQYFARDDQYLDSVGIDLDLPITDSSGDRFMSGVLRPSGYSSFEGASIDSTPIAIFTTPKTALVYVVMSNGKLVTYNSSFASETAAADPAGGGAGGAGYYNNYIYIFGTGSSQDDIARYGPLDGSASLTDSVWTGATLGSQTALTNTTYPVTRAGSYLNHWSHVHIDGKMYFCDFKAGTGYIHYIKTTKTTDEGDTNDGSTYNALDLPFGYMPMAIESYGKDLLIIATQTSNSILNQGKAALFLWDTISQTYYDVIPLSDPLGIALEYNDDSIFVFTGSVSTGVDSSNGYRVSRYLGGRSFEEVYYSDVGMPPLQGAVTSWGNRVSWGSFTQTRTTTAGSPNYYGVVLAYRSKKKDISDGVHGVAKISATINNTRGHVTALANIQQDSFSSPKYVIGWIDQSVSGDTTGIDKQGTTYGTSIFRKMFQIGRSFKVTKIRFGLGAAVAANMTITPTIYLDDFSSSSTSGLPVINNTNFTGSERYISYFPMIEGKNNFCFELVWTGTALLPVLLPIEVNVEILEN